MLDFSRNFWPSFFLFFFIRFSACVSLSSFFSFSFHTRWLLLLPSNMGFSLFFFFFFSLKKKKNAPSDRYGAHKQCEKYWVMTNEWWCQTGRVFWVISYEWQKLSDEKKGSKHPRSFCSLHLLWRGHHCKMYTWLPSHFYIGFLIKDLINYFSLTFGPSIPLRGKTMDSIRVLI